MAMENRPRDVNDIDLDMDFKRNGIVPKPRPTGTPWTK